MAVTREIAQREMKNAEQAPLSALVHELRTALLDQATDKKLKF